ncbi:MAG TPA: hypothetical protein VFD05_00390 [Bacilli bacterium]|nr:hypothetical protein [Bacilli bacterium]
MKNNFKKFGVMLLALLLVVGCNNGEESSVDKSSEPDTSESVSTSEPITSESSEEEQREPVTADEFAIAFNEIALSVPLVVDKTRGTTIYGNAYRNKYGLPVPDLSDGNDFILTTSGLFYYEDDDNEVYIDAPYTVTWSYVEAAGYAEFEFETDDNGVLTATPGYPTYKPEYDGGGNPLHEVPAKKPGRLVAEIHMDGHKKKTNFDMYLMPIELIEWYRIRDVRDLPISTLIGVRGYVTGIFPDWNNATINDGKVGFGLFKVQDYRDLFAVGDLIEAVGQFTAYNGLYQIQWIKSVKKVSPTDYPEIAKPAWKEFTTDELADQMDRAGDDLFGPLQDYDGALIKFDKPFRMVEVKDRDNKVIDVSEMDITGKYHTDIYVEADTTDYPLREKVTIKLSINYHMGGDNQKDIRDFFMEHGNAPFYYEGHLGAYNEFVLAPYGGDTLVLAD